MTPLLAQRKRILQVIWLAMMGAVMACVAVHLGWADRPGLGTLPAFLPPVFMIQAAVSYAIAWVVHYRTVRAVRARVAPTRIQRLSPKDRVTLQGRLQTAAIVSLTLLGCPPLLGLAADRLPSGSPPGFEWLAGTSLVLLVLFRLQGYPAIVDALEKLDVRDPASWSHE